jgi:hypothetical protein
MFDPIEEPFRHICSAPNSDRVAPTLGRSRSIPNKFLTASFEGILRYTERGWQR